MRLGVFDKPKPATDIPHERDEVEAGMDGDYIGDEEVGAALQVGALVMALNYYGVPYAWKVADGNYRGVLLQYRSVTENATFDSAADCVEWFRETFRSTCG
jgi:hypothetical protein